MLFRSLEKKGFVSILADEKDKRKQRIGLTNYCRAFCSENEDRTAAVMEKMFRNISEEQIQATIQTIIQMEDNLKEIKEDE